MSEIARGTLLGGSVNAPYLRLPTSRVFDERADRLVALAEKHPLSDYLRLLATVARAQHAAFAHMDEPPLPALEQRQRCLEHGIPLLSTAGWARAPVWRGVLDEIVADLDGHATHGPVRDALARIARMSDAEREANAGLLIAGDFRDVDVAAAPFMAAALQVYWVRMAAALGVEAFGRGEKSALCPVCGSPPVASVVRVGPEQGLRYAVCGLCLAEWNVVRIKCVRCESTKGISYYAIAGGNEAIKAEYCPSCSTYLKIMHMNKSPSLDPVADDIASLPLDLLMADEGRARYGVNLFLLTSDIVEEHDTRMVMS
jgi:FdhE protein